MYLRCCSCTAAFLKNKIENCVTMAYYDSPSFWYSYYHSQALQSGHGIDGFHGNPYQRGAGLGNFFRSLFRVAVPVLKQAARATAGRVGRQALTAVGNIASDITAGKSAKNSIVSRGKEAAANVLHETANALQTGGGLGRRPYITSARTVGTKRRRKTKKLIAKVKRRLVKSDIFNSRG